MELQAMSMHNAKILALVVALAIPAAAAFGVDTLYDQRFKQWTEAAESGDPEAQYDLGNAYLRGTEVARDMDKAFHWFEKAAKQDHAKAEYKLGYIYYQGQGVSRNYSRAYQWLRKAANQDYSPAQFYMGKLYASGNGVERDLQKALYWFGRAADDDYTPAHEEIKKVRAAIAAEEAQREAEREQQRLAKLKRQNRPKPRPAPKRAPEPEPEPERQAKPAQANSYDPMALLLDGGFVTEDGQPALYMPSDITRCQQAGNEVICRTRNLNRSTDHAKVTYVVKATFSRFTQEGQFVAQYRTNNKFVIPTNPDDPTPRSDEELPPTGWEKVRTVLKCRFTDTDTVNCINDNFKRETFTR